MSSEILMVFLLGLMAAWTLGGRSGWLTCLGLGALGLALSGLDTAPRESHETPAVGADNAMATSTACRSCHPAHYQSWWASHHRTMTRPADPKTVNARFEGTLTHGPMAMTLSRDDGRLWVRGEGPREEVSMVTGSHHLESFWIRQDRGWFIQLPWVWLIGLADRGRALGPGGRLVSQTAFDAAPHTSSLERSVYSLP